MKAVLKNGTIELREPLPADWREGTELEVEKADSEDTKADLDKWHAELEAACAEMNPEDDRILQQAILEIRKQEKDLARTGTADKLTRK